WWVIFGNIYHKLLQYIKAIMENPYTSMATVFVSERKRDSLRDNRLQHESTIRYFGEPRDFVTVRRWELMDDNHENRFVKFILQDISRRFNNIYKVIRKDAGSRMTIEYKDQLGFVNNTLKEMEAHSLFKRVGEMTHPDPMSNVMRLHPMYAGVREEWYRLKQAYNHFEGIFKMELRNIGYLYKIWCFFKIERILRMRLGPPYRVEKIPELVSASMQERQLKDMNAGVAFRMENGNIVELFHELYYEIKGEGGHSSIKPDIVLRIRRGDRPRNIACSCIFIVRYQYKESGDEALPDLPLDADIHEVSSMRENIFQSEKPGKQTNMIRTGWIGGYVLYPGKGSKEQLQQELDKARKKGNRGGLALRPDDKKGSGEIVLRGQMDYLLENADKVINEILIVQGESPQSEDAFVFIAFIEAMDTVMINYLLNEEAEQFVYKDFIQRIGDGAIRYFAPYIEGQGISCFYEISGHYWKSRKEAFAPDHPLFENNTRKCMVLKLERKEILNGCCKVKGRINNKRFTTLKNLLNPKDEHIITIPEQRIAPK
ncbi:MAG TPA: DUF2357 domain-containing protein, partial [Chitinophaga sp.]|nr:DUF2357 domain-containing protein [Chitinophaga sp.]